MGFFYDDSQETETKFKTLCVLNFCVITDTHGTIWTPKIKCLVTSEAPFDTQDIYTGLKDVTQDQGETHDRLIL